MMASVCHVCSRSFTRTAHLERHLRSHTNEKPFRCHACGRRYARRDTLLRHQKDHTALDLQSASPSTIPGSDSLNTTAIQSNPPPINNAVSSTTRDRNSHSMLDFDSAQGLCPMDLSYADSLQFPGKTVTQLMPENGAHSANSRNDWMFENDSQLPSWVFDTGLDISAFGSPFGWTMAEVQHTTPRTQVEVSDVTSKTILAVEALWFTKLPPVNGEHGTTSGIATPSLVVQPSHNQIDDDYRQTLQKKLQVSAMDRLLPSSDFLNLCVRRYFARFHPVFPVIHAATFRPSKENALLLLSICSVGSLFMGSTNAASRGARIFEWLNKAILATWDRLMVRGEADEVLSMVQAALIGQTFGLLSGDPKHLATVDAFHGCVISWARQKGFFNAQHDMKLSVEAGQPNLEAVWRTWANKEEAMRVALGLYIHDAELASIYHHEPYLRHTRAYLSLGSAKAFMAVKPEEWARHYNAQRDSADAGSMIAGPGTSLNCGFSIYACLESIAARIMEETTNVPSDFHTENKLSKQLVDFHERFVGHPTTIETDDYGIMILWHLCFISIFTDFDLLERAIGRDGYEAATSAQAKLVKWAASLNAKRCIMHALLLRKRLQFLSVNTEPAIHVPRAVFFVAMIWHCYAKYVDDIQDSLLNSPEINFPEFKMLGLSAKSLLYEAHGHRTGRFAAIEADQILCQLTDLLQKIGHWEIARRFASLLEAMSHLDIGS